MKTLSKKLLSLMLVAVMLVAAMPFAAFADAAEPQAATKTFPVKVYSMVRFSVTPEVNAASTLLIVLTVVLTAIALKVQGARNLTVSHA